MKVEVLPSSSSFPDGEEKSLIELIDAFGATVSLEDIASAYCQAERDVCATAEILGNKKSGSAGISTTKLEDGESKADVFAGCQSENHLGKAHSAKAKQKRSSASMGTVAGLIGREYVTPRVQFHGSRESCKPMKLSSDEIPETEIWDEKKDIGSTSRNESMKSDMEEFLYTMLGNGYQLEMNVIHDVVGQCGYDMQKSVDKLLDMSAATLEKSDDVIGIASGNTVENSLSLEAKSPGGQLEPIGASERSNNDIQSTDHKKKKKNAEWEILESLFKRPDVFEQEQEPLPVRQGRRLCGQVVSKPPQETIIDDFTFITREPVTSRNDEANKNSYESLRNAVKEYWFYMKQYYKAAADAFTEMDYEKAQLCMEKGNFYMRKAREADEESSQKLIDNSDEEEEISLNMQYLDPKDALHHLKLHLASFSCLPSVQNLKVVVGPNDGRNKDGRRKRRITTFLEKEEIPWSEEGDGWIISIRLKEIDPSKFSFEI